MDLVGRLAGAALVAALAALVLAVTIPLVMDDGTSAIGDHEARASAQEAIEIARTACVDNPIQRTFTLKLRIESIRPVATCVFALGSLPGPGIRAQVSERTFFGLTLRSDTVHCGTVTCFPS